MSLNVRPHKVVEVAKWLVSNGDLYKEEGITFNNTWLEGNFSILLTDGERDTENLPQDELVQMDCGDANISKKQETQDNEDTWSEDEAEILTSLHFVSDNERDHILNLAHGEGNRPMSIFRDRYSEELAYPGIFLGQKRPDNTDRFVDVHYSEICKSELRRSDRRACNVCGKYFQ